MSWRIGSPESGRGGANLSIGTVLRLPISKTWWNRATKGRPIIGFIERCFAMLFVMLIVMIQVLPLVMRDGIGVTETDVDKYMVVGVFAYGEGRFGVRA